MHINIQQLVQDFLDHNFKNTNITGNQFLLNLIKATEQFENDKEKAQFINEVLTGGKAIINESQNEVKKGELYQFDGNLFK